MCYIQGIVYRILKPGVDDNRLPLNYHGITLVSVPSKIYCKVFNYRLDTFLETNDVLCEKQNGFRTKRSCEDNIYNLFNKKV